MKRIARLCAATFGSIVIGFAIFDLAEQRRLDKDRAKIRAEAALRAVVDAHQDGAR